MMLCSAEQRRVDRVAFARHANLEMMMISQQKSRPLDGPRPSDDAPELAQADWDEIAAGVVPARSDQEGPMAEDPSGELPGEDDDNPYQESDEALPDDREEGAIGRDLADRGDGPFQP
jgi:hypothetical protein